MTISMERTMTDPAIHIYGQPRLLAGVVEHGRVDFTHHLQLHGGVHPRRRGWLSEALKDTNLLGRGGAAFPVGIKLDAMPEGSRSVVLVNGSEGEPASMKDRVLMRTAPHLVLDGALIVAHALGTRDISIAVLDQAAFDSLSLACRERPDAADIGLIRTDHGFVGGEIRGVVNGLNGGRPVPGGRRVLPVDRGVDGRPTFASNVETFAQIALLAGLGTSDFARTGATEEPGTTLLTMVGDVPHPGVIEVPTGVPIAALLQSSDDAPVLIGGYHGTWTTSIDGLTVDRARLKAAGVPLNSGVIARLSAQACAVDEVVRVSAWLAGESAGQCGPCFFGLPAIATSVEALAVGGGSAPFRSLRRHLDAVAGRGACAHPDGSVQFVRSALGALEPEFLLHAQHGGCGRPATQMLPVPGRNS